MEKYLIYILGTLLSTIGLIFLSFYIAIFFFSPVIENIFSIDMNISSALLIIAISFTLNGFFIGFYSISKDSWEYANLWIIISFLLSFISFLFQLYKLASLGPTWLGLEFFGINGNKIEAMYICMMLFLINLAILVICGILVFRKFRGEEWKF